MRVLSKRNIRLHETLCLAGLVSVRHGIRPVTLQDHPAVWTLCKGGRLQSCLAELLVTLVPSGEAHHGTVSEMGARQTLR